eukprot:171828-Ditylum_brightwellii.AAC.1
MSFHPNKTSNIVFIEVDELTDIVEIVKNLPTYKQRVNFAYPVIQRDLKFKSDIKHGVKRLQKSLTRSAMYRRSHRRGRAQSYRTYQNGYRGSTSSANHKSTSTPP